jgi:hypothetical protein
MLTGKMLKYYFGKILTAEIKSKGLKYNLFFKYSSLNSQKKSKSNNNLSKNAVSEKQKRIFKNQLRF